MRRRRTHDHRRHRLPARDRADRDRARGSHEGRDGGRRCGRRPRGLRLRPGARDRGDRLQHDRPAGGDDDPRGPDPGDRRLRLHRDPRRADLEGPPPPRGPRARGDDGAALRVPRQPDDDPARRPGHVPALRRTRHRPDPADRDRDHRLQHRRHGDPDRRPAEHHHRRPHRPLLQPVPRQPGADRGDHLRGRDRGALRGVQIAPAGRGEEQAVRHGPRRRLLDPRPRRAAAHRPGSHRHDPAVLRPPGARDRAGDSRADGRHGRSPRHQAEAGRGARADRVADPLLLPRPVRDRRCPRGDRGDRQGGGGRREPDRR